MTSYGRDTAETEFCCRYGLGLGLGSGCHLSRADAIFFSFSLFFFLFWFDVDIFSSFFSFGLLLLWWLLLIVYLSVLCTNSIRSTHSLSTLYLCTDSRVEYSVDKNHCELHPQWIKQKKRKHWTILTRKEHDVTYACIHQPYTKHKVTKTGQQHTTPEYFVHTPSLEYDYGTPYIRTEYLLNRCPYMMDSCSTGYHLHMEYSTPTRWLQRLSTSNSYSCRVQIDGIKTISLSLLSFQLETRQRHWFNNRRTN